MNDPIARLKAGLDEDEQLAKAATEGGWQATETDYPDPEIADEEPDRAVVFIDHTTRPDAITVLFEADWGTLPDASHAAAHDPVRVLREVAAKREILDKYEATEAYCKETQYSEGMWGAFIARDAWKQAVLALATIYPAAENTR